MYTSVLHNRLCHYIVLHIRTPVVRVCDHEIFNPALSATETELFLLCSCRERIKSADQTAQMRSLACMQQNQLFLAMWHNYGVFIFSG